MKMDTLRSPCPYDAAARHALQSVDLRRPAILHYALWAAVFSISQVVRLPPDSVAKVVLLKVSKILRTAGAVFV